MIAAEVVFQGKYRQYIEHTACARVVWETIVCCKATETPHPKPDVSMLLALERKRLALP